MASMLDPATAMMMKEELQPEEDLGEATKLDTFNCDLNVIIDESGSVYVIHCAHCKGKVVWHAC